MIAQQVVEVGWVSNFKTPLTLFWIGYDGKRVLTDTIMPGDGGTQWSISSLGHVFELEDLATNEFVGTYTIKHHSFFVLGTNADQKVERNITEQAAATFYREFRISHEVTRTFTDLGFSIGKLPPDLWASISSYYYNNQMNIVREDWDSKGKNYVLLFAVPIHNFFLNSFWPL